MEDLPSPDRLTQVDETIDEALGVAPWFRPELFEDLRKRRGVTWGRPVRVLNCTESTNDLALSASPTDAKTGIVWIAREQTKGRGRRGNSWTAPAGESLLMSTLLRYPGAPERLGGVSLVVGLACRDAVAQFLFPERAAQLKVKWPNDLWADDEKLGGILIETRTHAAGVDLIVGIGLNVHTTEFPETLGRATSLALLGASRARLRFEALLVEVLAQLEARLAPFFSRGLVPFLAELRTHDALYGRAIEVDGQSGIARGVDRHGRLLLETADRTRVALSSGHVTVR